MMRLAWRYHSAPQLKTTGSRALRTHSDDAPSSCESGRENPAKNQQRKKGGINFKLNQNSVIVESILDPMQTLRGQVTGFALCAFKQVISAAQSMYILVNVDFDRPPQFKASKSS
jgi:hypothetical protein